MSDPSHDWQERVDQADERLKEVNTLITSFLRGNPYGVVSEFQSLDRNQVALVATMTEHRLVPRRAAIVLAEVLGHLRSSLDHLMCALAVSHSKSLPKGTQFPIFKDRPLFHALNSIGNPKKGSGLWQMRGASSGVQALIEGMQPYHPPPQASPKPLWMLHDLAVIDKHQKPHLTGAIMESGSIGINNMWGVSLYVDHWGVYIGPFKKGTEVGRATFTITDPDNYKVEMNTNFTYSVAFDPKGPGAGSSVVPTVEGFIRLLRTDIFPKLEPFV